jgi:hypothetical protein
VQEGTGSFLALIAILSADLALINLLPIPVLDGGTLLFCTAELVLRRPVPKPWGPVLDGGPRVAAHVHDAAQLGADGAVSLYRRYIGRRHVARRATHSVRPEAVRRFKVLAPGRQPARADLEIK